jgi:hypothetical protein
MTQQLLDAANDLAQLLESENAALTRLDFPVAVALAQSKETALLRLTENFSAVPAQEQDSLPPVLGKRMQRLLAENRRLLERAITIQTRVVGIVIGAAAPPPVAEQYAAAGSKRRRRRAAAAALSLGA